MIGLLLRFLPFWNWFKGSEIARKGGVILLGFGIAAVAIWLTPKLWGAHVAQCKAAGAKEWAIRFEADMAKASQKRSAEQQKTVIKVVDRVIERERIVAKAVAEAKRSIEDSQDEAAVLALWERHVRELRGQSAAGTV